MSGRVFLLFFLAGTLLQGCGSEIGEEVVSLRGQVERLSRQIEEMRRDVEEVRTEVRAVRERSQKVSLRLGNLEAEVHRLKSPPASPVQVKAEKVEEKTKERVPAPPQRTEVSCGPVWRLLGRGKDEATIARELGITVGAVRLCDQMVGRGGGP